MPWKETCAVDERVRFIALVNESNESFSALCAQFKISRKTGYKWVARYEALGPAGLVDGRPVALHLPHSTPPEMIHRLVELRKERPTWGPKKLRARLQTLGITEVPAASTIGDLLKKHGLVHPRRRRVYTPKTSSNLAPAPQPNDTWCADFKGHFALGTGQRCHPLTVTDQCSRYLIKCEALEKPNFEAAWPHLERAFHEFGMPSRLRTDNGPPFATAGIGGLSVMAVSLVRLGVTPERIDPGHPEQNGCHERMHKTLKQEATSPPGKNLIAQQLQFDLFRGEFNDVRPHEALGQKTPASVYSPSPRPMPSKPQSPEYPDGVDVRRANADGKIHAKGHVIHLSRLIANEPVGLLPTDDDVWDVYYGEVLLAELSLKNKEVKLVKRR